MAISPLQENIENRAKQLGWKEHQIAVNCGLHIRTLQNIRQGTYEPTLNTLYALAAGLRCEAWQLIKPNCFVGEDHEL